MRDGNFNILVVKTSRPPSSFDRNVLPFVNLPRICAIQPILVLYRATCPILTTNRYQILNLITILRFLFCKKLFLIANGVHFQVVLHPIKFLIFVIQSVEYESVAVNRNIEYNAVLFIVGLL